MDNDAVLASCYLAIGILGYIAYLAVYGADRNIIASGSVLMIAMGSLAAYRSIQKKRTARMEARIAELESKQRD